MQSYVTLGTSNPERDHAFYDRVLATIGWVPNATFEGFRGYSPAGQKVQFWCCTPFDGQAATAGNGTMVAFPARSRAEVDAFYAAAMANGGSDEGGPGLRPNYTPTWYAAYLRDPTGNKIAVFIDE